MPIILVFLLIGSSLQAAGVVEEWLTRYNGPVNGQDTPYAIAIDGSGNIYVTGTSHGSGRDYATIKYDVSGNELWVARYNGPGSGEDYAYAIAVDAEGNVYVTGSSVGGTTNSDSTTIKYNPNGNELWVARYNGPENGGDWASDIALDAAGNVYVTGGSGWYDPDHCTNYVTIKYDPNGNELWVARYGSANDRDESQAIAVDDACNVYVTGYVCAAYDGGHYPPCDYDMATVKYDSNGNQLWVACYDGPFGRSWDDAYAIAVDDVGSVYITGKSNESGTNQSDYTTVKYDTNGNELWVARYDGLTNNYNDDEPSAIAVDDVNSVYVTGSSVGNNGYLDYATVKYDPNGNELWVARYNGPANMHDEAKAIALDDVGSVYVTGGSRGSDTGDDYFDYATVKYDTNGNMLWGIRYDAPANEDRDYGYGIALDASGNVYVTGTSYSSSDRDYLTVKYSQCTMVGDIDCDKDVDFGDFAVLAEHWQESNCGNCNWADQDGDEDIDFNDLKKLSENWLEGKI